MTKMVSDGAPELDRVGGAHQRSPAAAWTVEQTAYSFFLKNACVRLKVIAVEVGIEPDRIDAFVSDALVIIHHARHTQARGRQDEAWIEAIARNLGRKRRYGSAGRGGRRNIFLSLWRFGRDHKVRAGYAEAQRRTSAKMPPATIG